MIIGQYFFTFFFTNLAKNLRVKCQMCITSHLVPAVITATALSWRYPHRNYHYHVLHVHNRALILLNLKRKNLTILTFGMLVIFIFI